MFLDKNMLSAAILFVGIYIIAVQPFATTLATAGIGIIIYTLTKSQEIVLGFMIASIFIRGLNRIVSLRSDPVGVEAFQDRSAESIHTRLKTVENKHPLAPKVEAITGVLESPHILDNTPLQAIDSLAREGVPGASIPASSNAHVRIHPPAEGFVDVPNGSVYNNPKANPVLQNGDDDEALNTSLVGKGTDMAEPLVVSSDMAGMGKYSS